ncbi:hypothetical protein AYO20_10251 [Fonsecaea nubica]|uniref:Uncharacterized protein n=1 Tax=Fonsecaea nubica TaxID=856822 RepID=A0A178C984_9EURO|nr:hypothetical protein AYO20_10251 [Fonsecaea nubica]OAL26117.1 hypothetical protein AYO20_10251 [Fonsecaea nubica]
MPPQITTSDATKSTRHHTWSNTSVKSGSTGGGGGHHRHHEHQDQRPQLQQRHGQHQDQAARKASEVATVQRWLNGGNNPGREDVLDRVARAFKHGTDKGEGEAKTKTETKL